MDEKKPQNSTVVTSSNGLRDLIDRHIQSSMSALTEKQSLFLTHYITSGNITEACQRAGIDRSTPYNWHSDPSFREMVRTCRLVMLEIVLEEASIARVEAIRILREQMQSQDEKARRAAAKIVWESGCKLLMVEAGDHLRELGEELKCRQKPTRL